MFFLAITFKMCLIQLLELLKEEFLRYMLMRFYRIMTIPPLLYGSQYNNQKWM